MACACSGSGLTAVLEENHFGQVLSIKKANGAFPADIFRAHTATRASTMDLMNPRFATQVKRAPSLDKNCATRLSGKQVLQFQPFHFLIHDRRGALEVCVVQTGRREDAGAWQ